MPHLCHIRGKGSKRGNVSAAGAVFVGGAGAQARLAVPDEDFRYQG